MKKNNFSIFLLMLLIWLGSCQKEETELMVPSDRDPEVAEKGMVLGKKLNNPYSVENMKKAYANLIKSKAISDSEPLEIKTTHLYVRTIPRSAEELDRLLDDTLIEIFDYPLDYEILEEGTYYHDPSIRKGEPSWLYTVIPVKHQMARSLDNFEVLEKCFIPEIEEDDFNLVKNSKLESVFDKLETEAYKVSGNAKQLFNDDGAKKKRKPQGYIKVHNTFSGLEGVRSVKVRVHNFVKIASKYTNSSGYYKMGKYFRTKVHYGLIFRSNTGFKIWGNWAFLAPANYNMGWHSNSGYSKNFYRNSVAWKWATVNNAVYTYRQHCTAYGITKPPTDLRVWVFEKNNGTIMGSASMLRRTWGLYGFTTHSQLGNFFLKMNGINISLNYLALITKFAQPDITIHVNSNNVSTPTVYNVTYHECGHASHWKKVGSYYWVKYINYIITYGAYGDGSGANAGYCGVGEIWGNYIGALMQRRQFGYTTPLHLDWWWFNEGEDWYNPGFMKHVHSISDVYTSELYSCLTSSTNTISKLVAKLKTKTHHDSQVDAAYNRYTDWP